MRIHIAACAIGMLLPLSCLAADDGELWEVSTQMNIPGMPAGMAGMGQAPQRVCTGKDPKEDATRRPDMQKCKVVDLKQTATRMTLTMSCPEGQAVIDQTYNAARTEYKGTMTMKTRDGDMVMNMSGRKVGSCDVRQATREREEKFAKMKSQSDAQVAAMKRDQARNEQKLVAEYTKNCNEAAAEMDASKFPACYQPSQARTQQCTDKQFAQYFFPAGGRAACDPKKAEFCQKYRTEAGFTQAAAADRRGRGNGAEVCGLQRDKVQATLCSGALQRESLDFLSRHCPAEVKQAGAKLCPKAVQTEAWHFVAQNCPADAKGLFAKQCAGRQYTSLQNRKQRDMCTALAQLDDEDSGSGASASSAPAKPTTATEQVKQSVGKGLDKLRGLFGR